MTYGRPSDRDFGPRRPDPPPEIGATDRLLAYEQIRQLAARYALAMDSRDLDALAHLFVEDFESWSGERGRDALRRDFGAALRRGLGGRVGFTQIGTHVINLLAPDLACGTLYCSAALGDRDNWIRQDIAYEDVYERRDGEWLFAERRHQLFYGFEPAERPLAQDEARWPERPLGLGTLPYAWPSWRRFEDEQGQTA
ncbi:MAG: nuclear transport factor 2 family protein [Actinobacteria bacterium]|nr:nuclear transport factor 2 family protein [Actinomycetota bacterium]